MLKCDQDVHLPSPMTAQYLMEFCKNNGGSKGDHEVYVRADGGLVTLYLVKRLPDRREDQPNGKVWAFRVLPKLPDEV